MICRIWRGWTSPQNADAYERVVRGTVIPDIEARRIEGFRHIDLMRRAEGQEIEFATMMWFDDIAAVKRFTGDDYEVSHVPPVAQAVLAHFDPRAAHYEVLDRRPQKESNVTDASPEAVAWRRYEQMRPRTEVKIDPALYADYAGHYEFADGHTCVVTQRDGRLFTRIIGQPEVEAFPEGDYQFFLKVVPAQITFVRDPQRIVSSLVLHQSGYDRVATRVAEAETKRKEEALAERIKNKTPVPDSETILRRLIAEHQRGEPDYERMTAPMAAAAREQIAMIQTDLARMGALRGVSFKGVGKAGWDVYEVHFEHGDMEWRFALAPDGKVGGILLRPSL